MHKVRKLLRKKSFWAALVAVVIVVVAVLELTNTTYIFHKKTVPETIPVKTSKESKTSSSNNAKQSNSSSSSSGNTVNGTNQSASQTSKAPSSTSASTNNNLPLVQPYGDLVSNHHPGQDGSNTKEQSTCNSTPGASCYIQFTNTSTGQVTKLPAQTINSNGTTIWNWDANTLTSGSWEVKAVASSNGQTKSATDSIKLVVQ